MSICTLSTAPCMHVLLALDVVECKNLLYQKQKMATSIHKVAYSNCLESLDLPVYQSFSDLNHQVEHLYIDYCM